MRRTLLFLPVIVFLFACGQKKAEAPRVEKPDDLIPEKQMVQVMAEVHLLEAAISMRSPKPPSRMPHPGDLKPVDPLPQPGEQKAMPYYDIFKQYGVTREQYERSFEWYALDAEKLGTIYDEVIAELIKRQAKEQSGGPVVPANPANTPK